jgi:hypothetical protein
VIELAPFGTMLPLICYEAIFPQDVAGAPVRPDVLLQITNDAWFGEFSGPFQHLAQARMRAVEQNLPMIRVANTGVSAMIDAGGRIVAEIPLGEAARRRGADALRPDRRLGCACGASGAFRAARRDARTRNIAKSPLNAAETPRIALQSNRHNGFLA